MSAKATRWVWNTSVSAANDLLVLLAIADECDHWGENATCGVDRLMKMTKLGRSTIYDCLKRLQKSGELAIQQEGGGRGRRTRYALPKMKANGPESGLETVQNPESQTVQNLESQTVQNPEYGNRNRPETVRKPSGLDAQNGNTLSLTQKQKRAHAREEKPRAKSDPGVARFPEWTPEYRRALENLVTADPDPVTAKPEIQQAAPRVRGLLEQLSGKPGSLAQFDQAVEDILEAFPGSTVASAPESSASPRSLPRSSESVKALEGQPGGGTPAPDDPAACRRKAQSS